MQFEHQRTSRHHFGLNQPTCSEAAPGMAGGSALIRGHSQSAIWMHLQSLREEKKKKKKKRTNKIKPKNLGSLLAGHCKSLSAVHFHSSMPAVIKSDSTLFIFGGFVQTPAEERKKRGGKHSALGETRCQGCHSYCCLGSDTHTTVWQRQPIIWYKVPQTPGREQRYPYTFCLETNTKPSYRTAY